MDFTQARRPHLAGAVCSMAPSAVSQLRAPRPARRPLPGPVGPASCKDHRDPHSRGAQRRGRKAYCSFPAAFYTCLLWINPKIFLQRRRPVFPVIGDGGKGVTGRALLSTFCVMKSRETFFSNKCEHFFFPRELNRLLITRDNGGHTSFIPIYNFLVLLFNLNISYKMCQQSLLSPIIP